MLIDISKLNKAEVLAALYNNSKQQGLGFLCLRGNTGITKEECAELIKEQTYFDYLYGRVMKVAIGEDMLDPRDYDRDNGEGAAARALVSLLVRSQKRKAYFDRHGVIDREQKQLGRS